MRQPVQFGKYLLLDRISVGGMAEVFKAKSFGVQGFEKVIAIKRILPSMGEDEDFISMFIDEAKIAGQLAHANIGQIHELGEVDGAHFIAMEYIQGRDLLQLQKRYRKRKQQLPVATACFIVMKVCEGLNYAHKKRDVLGANLEIVHRDCSPQNVVVSYEGEVKLIDFGIARAASRSSRTQAGVLKGKFAYMSPEQVRGLPLDRRSDIFSLGTILFECLTGERLFNAESDFSTLERVRNAEFDRKLMKAKGVPPEVEAIVFKALERSTEDRYQWCSEMRADIARYLQTIDTAYTSRSLGEDVRKVFAKELQRDRELMDAYAKITKEDGLEEEPELEIFVEGTGEEKPRPRSPKVAASPLARGSQPRRPTSEEEDDGDFDDGATEVFGEIGMAELLHDMGIKAKASETPSANRPETASDEPKVEILDQKSGSAPAVRPPPPPPVPSGKPAMLGVSPEAAAAGGPPTPVPAEAPRYSRPVAPGPVPRSVRTPVPPVRRVASYALDTGMPLPRQSTNSASGTNKLLLGLVVAVVAGLLYYGVKTFVLSDSSAVATQAETRLIVMVGDKKSAEVYLGGKKVGDIVDGEDLVITDLEPGKFDIKVQRAGADACSDTITVTTERAKYYNCAFSKKMGASLRFEGLRKTDKVVVDAKEVPLEDLEEALMMHAGKEHNVAVSRDGVIIDEFTVTLRDGEERRHQVPSLEGGTAKDPSDDPGEDGATPAKPPVDPKAADPQAADPAKSAKPPETEKAAKKRALIDLGGKASPRKPEPRDVAAEPVKPVDKPVVSDTHGYLTAVTKPWARIYIDGKDTGKQTPVTVGAKLKLKPGIHKVTFVADGKKYNFSVTIKAGKTTKMFKALTPQ
jgi:serine/threonine protein kinase